MKVGVLLKCLVPALSLIVPRAYMQQGHDLPCMRPEKLMLLEKWKYANRQQAEACFAMVY